MFKRRATTPPRPQPSRNDQYISRAISAYYRAAGTQHGVYPSRQVCALEIHMGREYVVLRNGAGVVAVYRVRAYDGILKRLKRWPGSIQNQPWLMARPA